MKTYTILLEGSQIITGEIQDAQEGELADLLYQPGVIAKFIDVDGPVHVDTRRVQAVYFSPVNTEAKKRIGF